MPLPHILVIDRDPLLSETVSQMLQIRGYIPTQLASFTKALGTLHGISFNAVIARIGSEEPYESIFLEEAKLLQPRLKIIITTSSRRPSPQLKHYDAVLSLPFDIDQLDETLRQVLGEQRNV